MDIVALIAIIILIAAIILLIHYYLQATGNSNFDIKDYFPSVNKSNNETYSSSLNSEDEKVSMGEKIKYTIKDIDMSSLNTEVFSKRLDTFLDEKSEELIENWSLATQEDLSTLEERCSSACDSIDDLEKRFSEYSNVTDEKINDLDKRLKAIEEVEDE